MSLKQCLGDILKTSTAKAFSLKTTDTLIRAVDALGETGACAVLIAADGVLRGIVTRGDLIRCLGQRSAGEDGPDRCLEEIMSAPVITADPGDTISGALKKMVDNGIKHLPLQDTGTETIILHLTDLLGCKADLLQAEVEQLHDYIEHLHDAGKD